LPNPREAFISIFDRYGKLIYQFKGNQPGWDGTFNGADLPSTDYWFTLDYKDSNNVQQSFKAHFSLMR
jgi:gliding motility-associated-like protein